MQLKFWIELYTRDPDFAIASVNSVFTIKAIAQ